MRSTIPTFLTTGAVLLSLGACATPRVGSNASALRDPYETTNRRVYGFNRNLDKYALRPAAQAYRAVVPQVARRGVSNAFNNIDEPVSFINAVLQGKVKQAFRVADRFLLNSTLGVGGVADVATRMGRPEEVEDFGQTLAVWGIKSGPYLMLPLLGPSTFRDLGGFGVDFVTDPVSYARNAALNPSFVESGAQFGLETIDLRSKLIDAGADGVLEGSLDEYATVRSAFLQRRQSDIYDGVLPDDDDEPVEDAPLAPGATPPEPPKP
jgi:phospholipid-binding lipoprotein MlaA